MNDVAIAGAAQAVNRISRVEDAIAPLDMLTDVGRRAIDDAGGAAIESLIDAVVVVPVPGWATADAPATVASALGLSPKEGWTTAEGGEAGVAMLNWSARRIAAGDLRGVLLIGANALRTLELAQRNGDLPGWVAADDPTCPVHGNPTEGHDDIEVAAGLDRPVHVYPVIESALRTAGGRGMAGHQRFLGELFAPFTRVAASNPYAWFPTERTPEELSTPTAQNRIIGFPYTKLLNAVLSTDQAAAVVVLDRAAARAAGVTDDRLVSWWGGAEDAETAWYPTSRPDLAASPAMASAHSRTLAAAGVGVDDLAHLDLYSCFPAAVEVACDVLGLDPFDPRGLTVTGGLPYAGGPASAYTLHSLATMADRLRADPDALGLVTGNGWYLTKHSSVVLGARPRPRGLPTAASTAGPAADAAGWEARPVVLRAGEGTIVGYTVLHDRDNVPEAAVAVVEFGDGARIPARHEGSADALAAMEVDDQVGATVWVGIDDGPPRFEPV